ncbi:unnamed protein product [Discosporangium mesarthrocarpum]
MSVTPAAESEPDVTYTKGAGVDIHGAVERGDLESVQKYIKTGGDLERRDWDQCTALHIACAGAFSQVAQLLINKGANLNAKTRIEHTPLHLACRYGHFNIALALLVKGAQVDPRDNEQNTPLHKAASNGHDALCKELVKRGAAVSAVNGSNYTPLHWAAYKGRTLAVEALLLVGADLTAVAARGTSPLHAASYYGHLDSVAIMLKAGADPNVIDGTGAKPGDVFHEGVTMSQRFEIKKLLRQRYNLMAEGFRQTRAEYVKVWLALERKNMETSQSVLEVDLLWDQLDRREKELNMSKIGARDLGHAVKQLKGALEANRTTIRQKTARIKELEESLAAAGLRPSDPAGEEDPA